MPRFVLLTALFFLLLPLAQICAAEPAKITVALGQSLGPVNRLIFGNNIEAANGKDIFSSKTDTLNPTTGQAIWNPETRSLVPEVVAFTKELGIGMMRYPGGCLTHNFNWKDAVGPAEERKYFSFGIDEYISFCRAANCEPLMNVSAYVGGPQEAGELVEYLNAPATPEHPWAVKRAQWGHPEPYGVVYFEMGNESDHGNHHVKPFKCHSAKDYVEWFNACVEKMRAVDPGIKIGAHMGTGTGPYDPWNQIVAAGVKDRADFIAIHTYVVGIPNNEVDPAAAAERERLAMQGCLATGEQTEAMLGEYRRIIREAAGRDFPLAITEYNAGFVQEKPKPYRFSYGAALFSADYVRILLKPETNAIMANYWQYLNGYWGYLRGGQEDMTKPSRPWKKLPGYYLYRLWADHFGPEQLAVRVENEPRLEFSGFGRVRPCRVGAQPGEQKQPAAFTVKPIEAKGVKYTPNGNDAGVLELNGYAGDNYPECGGLEVKGGKTYRLLYEGRCTSPGKVAGGFGFGLCDARGWEATHSACAAEGVQSFTDWTLFQGEMTALPDAKALIMVWRLRGSDQPADARFEIRNLHIEEVTAECPPYSALTAAASRSADGKKLYLIVFNKHHAEPISAAVALEGGKVASAARWTVAGELAQVENVGEVASGEAVADVTPNGFTFTFPARSMTALEIELGQ